MDKRMDKVRTVSPLQGSVLTRQYRSNKLTIGQLTAGNMLSIVFCQLSIIELKK